MQQRMVGVAHPTTQHSWETALAFQQAARLRWYATSYYYRPNRLPDRLIKQIPGRVGKALQREMRRRYHKELDDSLIRRELGTEALERLTRLYFSTEYADKILYRRLRNFGKRLIPLIKSEPVDALWGPMDCADAFDMAKRRGVLCVLDQPIGHLAALDEVMKHEYEKHPEFFSSGHLATMPSRLDLQHQTAELADLIVVGSQFAAQTMIDRGAAAEVVRVVPYGYSGTYFSNEMPIRPSPEGRPLEFLYVGGLSPRKGIAYLLKAFSQIDPAKARLTLVGPLLIPDATFQRYAGRVNYVGQVHRPEVAAYMRRADCFILPSLFEGSALVLYEAVAAGLGIICTKQCGFDLLSESNGVTLSELNVTALLAVIYDLVQNRERLVDWGKASWAMRDSCSWAPYRSAVARLI
jgi:glycosyltransferase involved in cell wall biosynthesis